MVTGCRGTTERFLKCEDNSVKMVHVFKHEVVCDSQEEA